MRGNSFLSFEYKTSRWSCIPIPGPRGKLFAYCCFADSNQYQNGEYSILVIEKRSQTLLYDFVDIIPTFEHNFHDYSQSSGFELGWYRSLHISWISSAWGLYSSHGLIGGYVLLYFSISRRSSSLLLCQKLGHEFKKNHSKRSSTSHGGHTQSLRSHGFFPQYKSQWRKSDSRFLTATQYGDGFPKFNHDRACRWSSSAS